MPVTMPPPSSPISTHDIRVDSLSRRLKKGLTHLQKEAALYILEELLQDSRWSRNVRDESVKVVKLSQRQNGKIKDFS